VAGWRNIFGRGGDREPAGAEAPSLVEGSAVEGADGHIGHRRRTGWWEPTYAPALDGSLTTWDWDFSDNTGPSRRFVNGATLSAKVEKGDTYKLPGLTFRECDLQGDFKPGSIVLFDECKFIKCDFAFSSWKDTNFRKCTFEDCSFSLATFERCEFRDSTWIRIGLQGSKTEFIRCFVTNAADLVRAGFSGRRANDATLHHRLYQWHRLQGTKAHVARTLLLGHQQVGDDHTFYRTARLHDLQGSYAKIAQNIFSICYGPRRLRSFIVLLVNFLENVILRAFGLLNGWGSSSIRPLLVMLIFFLLFGILYSYLPFGVTIDRPFQKSFDLTTLIGYGNQTAPAEAVTLAVFQDLHALLSMVLYTVFFATIVSKLSRAR
jgi:uncharacterized protein YjbI with pentapeptide repeats